jgi:hypothetical protein
MKPKNDTLPKPMARLITDLVRVAIYAADFACRDPKRCCKPGTGYICEPCLARANISAVTTILLQRN